MPLANIVESVLVYDDSQNNSNPLLKHIDWKRSVTGVEFDEVFSNRVTLRPGESRTLHTITALDVAAEVSELVALTAKPGVWRFSALGAAYTGQSWATAIGVPAQSASISVNVDGTITLDGAGVVGTASPGAWVYLAGAGYGDGGSWSTANQGFWVVLAASANTFRLRRVFSDESEPVAETVVIAAAEDIQVINGGRPKFAYIRSTSHRELAGLWPVEMATINWVAIKSSTFVALPVATIDRFTVVPAYIAYLRIEASDAARVGVVTASLVGTQEYDVVPVAAEAPGWLEVCGFVVSCTMDNSASDDVVTFNAVYALKE